MLKLLITLCCVLLFFALNVLIFDLVIGTKNIENFGILKIGTIITFTGLSGIGIYKLIKYAFHELAEYVS